MRMDRQTDDDDDEDDDEDDEDDDSNDEFIVIYLRKAKERDGQCDVIFVVVRGDEKFPIVIIL